MWLGQHQSFTLRDGVVGTGRVNSVVVPERNHAYTSTTRLVWNRLRLSDRASTAKPPKLISAVLLDYGKVQQRDLTLSSSRHLQTTGLPWHLDTKRCISGSRAIRSQGLISKVERWWVWRRVLICLRHPFPTCTPPLSGFGDKAQLTTN